MPPENTNPDTPQRHPSERLTPADAQRILENVLGATRAKAFEIPDELPEGSEENPALLSSSAERRALPKKPDETELDDIGSDDGIEYLLGEE